MSANNAESPVYMPAKWFSCTALPLETGVQQQNYPRTRKLRSAGDNSSKIKFSTGCQTFRPKAGSPHASSPRILSAPCSVRPIFSYSRRHFRTSSTSPTSLTSEIQNEAIHRAISENAEQPCDRHQPIKLLVTNHLCNIYIYSNMQHKTVHLKDKIRCPSSFSYL